MKKLFPVVAAVIIMLGFYACNRSIADKPQSVDCNSIDASTNTYNLKIKAILDASCVNTCHNPFGAPSYGNVDMDGYANAKDAFVSKNALCAIKHEQGCLPMPDGSAKLADSLITYIQCWSESGYAE